VSESNKVAREEADSCELADCGQASKVTRGIPLVLLFELGNPPFHKLFLI
jgi:hypothetical protein